MIRIAFAGQMGSGKSVSAHYIASKYKVERISLAGPVKMIGALKDMPRAGFLRHAHLLHWAKTLLPDLDAKTHWDLAVSWDRDIEDSETDREMYQRIGTDSARAVKDTIWIDYFARQVEALGSAVNDDVRFKNELKALDALGFIVVRLVLPQHYREQRLRDRDGFLKVGVKGHASERDLDGVKMREFTNDGPIEHLYEFCDSLVAEQDYEEAAV